MFGLLDRIDHARKIQGTLKMLLLEVREQNKLLHSIMINQSIIDTTLANLNATVATAVAALNGAASSTPDNVVESLIDGVNAASATLVAAIPAGTVTPPPAPPV